MTRARFLLVLCLLPLCLWADDADIHGLAAHFDLQFRSLLEEKSIPGAAYGIVHNGRIVRLGYYGRTKQGGGLPVDADTLFRIASVSKSFAGTLAALLAHEERFSWDEPVTSYVPQFRYLGSSGAITIDDVVGQSTGFIPHAYDNLIEAGLPPSEIYPRFAALSPICAPGTCYTYQNSLFSLIEAVLEKTVETPYPALVEKRLFEPLQLPHASIGYEAYMGTSNRAEPHVRHWKTWHPVAVERDYYSVSSAAGVNASVLDMTMWALAALGHRPEVIPPTILDEIMTPRVRTVRELRRKHWRDHVQDAHYGLGWRIYRFDDQQLIYHGGWVSGFRAEIALSRKLDLGLVILMNAESSVIGELSSEFWHQAFDQLTTTSKPDERSTSIAATHP